MVASLPSSSRPGPAQALLFLALAFWLALVPLGVMAACSALNGTSPSILVQLGLTLPGNPLLPDWALGLVSTATTLGLYLVVFVPLFFVTRQPGREFIHTVATLLVAIAFYQGLLALARLPWPPEDSIFPARKPTSIAGLRLGLGLAFLLLGLGWVEARRHGGSLLQAWRRVGLRLWLNPSAMWLALAAGALIVWPWLLVGSLGSKGTTLATVVQALPNAFGEELLFRGFAFAWLWRALAVPLQGGDQAVRHPNRRSRGRFWAAGASLCLFVAAQGATVLPFGDWGVFLRFAAALCLGLLVTELTVRAAGSIWPAFVVHLLYDWFHYAFVDPRSTEEILHWLVLGWAPVAAGGIGFLLWAGRKVMGLVPSQAAAAGSRNRWGAISAGGLAVAAWLLSIGIYLAFGVPGFHPDGFLIFMEEQADLGLAASIEDSGERRAWVYQTLVEVAERSQAPLRTDLDRRGVAYRAHYLENVIEVLERPGLRSAFADEPGVALVLFQPGMRRYAHGFGLPNLDPFGAKGVEWNVSEVGADRVWEQGYTGQGITIGDADTGVAWQHPALKDAYRGWDGAQADHNYHWYDAWDGNGEPWDGNGHGTHTTGTVVGHDGENKVGLAPGSEWIACRNMRHGIGNPGSYLSCMEFLLAPFPLGGDPLLDGDPNRGAHIVNNSWGCPEREGCLSDTLHKAVENLRVSGQMMVVSAGNEGPACSSVEFVPATFDEVFSVGASSPAGRATGFSSRGPVSLDGSQRPKPDIVAPGEDIRSSVPGGYASMPGTSMAGPHVAGAVALLWSVDPSLIGDIDRTEALLAESAAPVTVDSLCPLGPENPSETCACGGQRLDAVPNNTYGWGLLDVWAAAQTLIEER